MNFSGRMGSDRLLRHGYAFRGIEHGDCFNV